jgi:hypothetical protein
MGRIPHGIHLAGAATGELRRGNEKKSTKDLWVPIALANYGSRLRHHLFVLADW